MNELFKENTQTYATRENAIKKLMKEAGENMQAHYVIAVNSEGRFFPVVIGSETIDLCHNGICVAS